MRQMLMKRMKHWAVLLVSSMLIVNFLSLIDKPMVLADSAVLNDVATMQLVELYKTDAQNNHISLIGENASPVEYGETLFGVLKWTFPDDPRDVVAPGSVFTYNLPVGITFSSTNGNLEKDGVSVGTFDINGTSITITYNTDQAGMEFCDGNNRNSELTFQGSIELANTNYQYVNSQAVQFNGTSPETIGLTQPANPTTLDVAKSSTLIDATNHKYEYTATVTSHGENNNVVIEDRPSAGLNIDAGTIVATTSSGAEYTAGTLAVYTYGFDYTIPSMSDGEIIYLTYTVTLDSRLYDPATATQVDSNYHGNVSNMITARSNTSPKVTYWSDIGTYDVYINKFPVSTTPDQGLMTWEILLYDIPQVYSDGYIIDTLPQYLEFVPGSVNVTYDGTNHNEDITASVIDGNKIKFTMSSDLITYLNSSPQAGCRITYSTRVTHQLSESVIYPNRAELFYGGNLIDAGATSEWFNMPDILSKDVEYNDATAPNANFTVVVNPIALDVDLTSDRLTLVDEIPEVMDLRVSTVQFTRRDGNAITSESFSYDESTRKLTLNVLDGVAYDITYSVIINRVVGTELNADNSTNRIYIEGLDPNINAATNLNCNVIRSAGSASSDSSNLATLNIIKHAEGDDTAVLSGAEFTLTPMSLNTSGTVSAQTAVTRTTGSSGVASFTVNRGTIYMLSETDAPDGYEADTDIYFYVFATAGSTPPSSVVYDGQSYTVTVVEADIASRDVYFANSEATTPPPPDQGEDTPPVDPPVNPPVDPPVDPPVTPVTPDETPVSSTTTTPAPTVQAEVTTTTTTAPSTATTEATAATTVPATTSTGEIDPNAVNGAGRDQSTESGTEPASTTAAAASVSATGECRISATNTIGIIAIFIAGMALIVFGYVRKEARD
ncbi:MAG: hypothetical protein MJ103_06510 [Saccharofermentans sp.]|nr:hypothetical protein [Saccharofermentans sp.]